MTYSNTTARVDHGYIVGVDLGKIADFTAIAVLRLSEYVEVVDERDEQRAVEACIAGLPVPGSAAHEWANAGQMPLRGRPKARVMAYELVHLDRVPLGTSYPAVVDHVGSLLWRPPLRGRAQLVVDATGVGVPIVDLLRQAGMQPHPITITSGGRPTRDPHGGGYHVPKRDLVDLLAVLLQTERLAIASALRFAQALADELLSFEARQTAAGNDTYGAREGAHDDLVLATAIAAWYGLRHVPDGAWQPGPRT
ncbi:MAG: hypothetical protein JWM95_2412 [Gemmatimonadetes bacterium]|nr:hypothetical protein [Gemmatimonadota bacterium]